MKILLTAALITACTGSQNYFRTYTPATGHTAKTVDAAAAAIVSAGYDIDSQSAGLVTSKWFHGEGLTAGTEDYRLMVTLTNGEYRVEALCRETGSGACSDDKRPQFVLDAMARVETGLK